MASMTMAALVSTAVEDGGLNQVLELTTVNSKIVEKIKSEGVVNLVEFTNLWTKGEYEKEILEYRDEVDELKNNRVELARLRSAVLLARAVLDRPPINPEDKTINDWEQPLDSAAKETISKAWKARYGIQLIMYLDPADPLVNRLYREFRQNSPSLIPVARIRSVYVDHNPSPEKRVLEVFKSFGGGLDTRSRRVLSSAMASAAANDAFAGMTKQARGALSGALNDARREMVDAVRAAAKANAAAKIQIKTTARDGEDDGEGDGDVGGASRDEDGDDADDRDAELEFVAEMNARESRFAALCREMLSGERGR